MLANEEVTADGRSDVGNYPVYRRPLRQWMLRITAYAERLLADLDGLDWPESIKQMQRNWIGASDGASFNLLEVGAGHRQRCGPGGLEHRGVHHPAGHAAGATYLVLAPEHPLGQRCWPTPAAGPGGRLPRGRGGSATGSGPAAAGKTGVFTGPPSPTRPPASRSRCTWPTTC